MAEFFDPVVFAVDAETTSIEVPASCVSELLRLIDYLKQYPFATVYVSRGRPGLTGVRKLSDDDVLLIRHKASQGVSQYSLAKRYGLTQASISRIVNRVTWRHL